jgi:Tfp pilus assembly pilus retraction ATPase PilT
MAQQEGDKSVAVNGNVLMQVHHHVASALKLVQTLPPIAPLMAVTFGIMHTEAMLHRIISELTKESSGLVIPTGKTGQG